MFPEPISRILINSGFCSVRSVRNFAAKSEILVNGAPVSDASFPVSVESDEITVNGVVLPKHPHFYFMLNKPLGYVCSAKSDRHPVVYDLFDSSGFFKSVTGSTFHTVGRLDSDTEGLLLLTTNGTFSHKLTSPEFHVEKTYLAQLAQPVPENQWPDYTHKFASGLLLPAEKKAAESQALPGIIEFLSSSSCKITVQEGQFHQVRRMVQACGNTVTSLKRISFGPLQLDESLKPGQYRKLSEKELSLLEI